MATGSTRKTQSAVALDPVSDGFRSCFFSTFTRRPTSAYEGRSWAIQAYVWCGARTEYRAAPGPAPTRCRSSGLKQMCCVLACDFNSRDAGHLTIRLEPHSGPGRLLGESFGTAWHRAFCNCTRL